MGFLQGLFSADGTVRENPKPNSSWIALTSKSRDLLQGVQLLLLNLGIKSSLMDRSRAPREGLFANRTKAGELRSYGSDGTLFERLGIFGKSRGLFLREIGFLNDKQRRLEPSATRASTRRSGATRWPRWCPPARVRCTT